TTDDERALAICQAQAGIADVHVVHGRISFTADEKAVAELSQALVEGGALIHALAPETVTLEDLFFSLTEGAAGERILAAREPAAPVKAAG
ncbi:MAG: hypothetical protein ACXVQR_06830, partial [Solirubrobacteraceae bacterium]